MKASPGGRPGSPALRVLLVGEPGIDGVFRHFEALAHYLCAQGVEIDLAYSTVRAGPALYELVKFVETHQGRTLDLRTGSWPGWRDVSAFSALLHFVRQRGPDVVHAHSSKAGALVRALRFCGIRSPFFYTPHAYYGMSRHRSPLPFLFDAIEAVLSRVGRTINVSRTEADYARARLRVPKARQTIIPNGIDCARFSPTTAAIRAEIRSALGLPRDALVLGTVARYAYQKDPLTLHKAVRLAMERDPRLWFVHIGSGQPLWNEVSALGAHGRIRRLPSFEPVERVYQALDGFVLASVYEGFSLSALEALATNLPLILTEVNGNLDFKDIGLDAMYWAPPRDAVALASAIDLWAKGHPCSPNHRDVTCRLFHDETIHAQVLNEYFAAAGFPMESPKSAASQTISGLIETQASIP